MPAIHPSCAMAHARASTPAPTTTVIMCVLAVNTFPANRTQTSQIIYALLASSGLERFIS